MLKFYQLRQSQKVLRQTPRNHPLHHLLPENPLASLPALVASLACPKDFDDNYPVSMFSVLTFRFVLVLRWEGGNVGARVHAMFIKSYVLFVSLVTRFDRSRFP